MSATSVPPVPATTSLLETSQIAANAPPRTDSAPSGADLRAAAERQRQLEKEGARVQCEGIALLSGRMMIVTDVVQSSSAQHESNSPALSTKINPSSTLSNQTSKFLIDFSICHARPRTQSRVANACV